METKTKLSSFLFLSFFETGLHVSKTQYVAVEEPPTFTFQVLGFQACPPHLVSVLLVTILRVLCMLHTYSATSAAPPANNHPLFFKLSHSLMYGV